MRSLANDLHRSDLDLDAILNVLQSLQKKNPRVVLDRKIHYLMHSPLVDVHDTESSILSAVAGFGATQRDVHHSTRGYTRRLPPLVRAYDLSVDLSRAGGLSYVPGASRFGGGMQADGNRTGITVGTRDEIRAFNAPSYTLACWLCIRTIPAGNRTVLIDMYPVLDLNQQHNNAPWIAVTAADGNETIGTECAVDTWCHVVATVGAGDNVKLWSDGVLRGTRHIGATPLPNSGLHLFGGHYALANNLIHPPAGTSLAWVSLLSGAADQAWVNAHRAGVLDLTALEEVVTVPFVGGPQPMPAATSGLFYG